MSGSGKDSEVVVRFMSLFAALKSVCSDQPAKLSGLAREDERIAALCREIIESTAYKLRKAERERRTLFASPVDPNFIAAWRDFEERYARFFESISLSLLLDSLPPAEVPDKSPIAPGEKWQNADALGFVESEALESLIDFAFDTGTDESRFNIDFIDSIREGINAWEKLTGSVGFNLRGVLRRRLLIPFVLVPRHVADKQGSEPASLLFSALIDAHEAFVYGAPRASLALLRAVLEATLREIYMGQGDNLESLINSVSDKFPNGVQAARLHKLRCLANGLLHINPDNKMVQRLREMDEKLVELEIASFMRMLRDLIEGAPN